MMRHTGLTRILILAAAAALSWGASDLLAGTPIKLASGPALSPDGKLLAFAWRGDVWVAASTGGSVRQLTTHEGQDGQPEFSPDGKWIAFVSDRTGSDQLHVVPVEGGADRQLTYHTEGYSLLEWYPDGKGLLTSATRDHFWRHATRFFRVGAESRGADQLLFDAAGSDGTLSPDGKRLLFMREGIRWWRKGYRGSQAGQIWLADLDRGTFQQLAHHEAGCRSPLWHPSGQKFYYVSGRSGAFNLWLRDLASAQETQLTDFSDDSVVMPCIARDGSTIAFRHLFDLYVLRPGSDKRPQKLELTYAGDALPDPLLRRTLDTASDVAFSQDGLEIAFIAGGDVWVMDTELREPKQVTNTPAEERSVVFAPDGQTLLFVSDQGQQSDIWKATRDNTDAYWWQNESFTLKQLTNDVEVEEALSWSPAGDLVAFVKGRGDLWVMNPDGGAKRRILTSWNAPDYDWAPDGKWFVYAVSDNDFNRDVFIAPLDGSRKPFNLSLHPDNDSSPVWSPDGTMIAYTGEQVTDERDIYYVYLRAEQSEESARDRKVKKALEKMEKNRKDKPAGAAAKAEPGGEAGKADTEPDKKAGEPAAEKAAAAPEKKEPKKESDQDKIKPVVIDWESIHDRIRHISIPHSTESGLFWSHDSKRLAFRAEVDGKKGTYTIAPPDDLKPTLLTTDTGSRARWISQGNQVLWLVRGVPTSQATTSGGKSQPFRFAVRQAVDVAARFQAVFLQCWRTMRDNFYDGRLNNRNWDGVYRKYAQMAQQAVDSSMLSQIVSMMLGELNGSHLGFYWTERATRDTSPPWRDVTVHLGLRFDPQYHGPGWKVRDVIWQGPAAKQKTEVEPGEIVLSVDDQAVDPDMDPTTVLNGPLERDVRLQVQNGKGEQRTVVIRPTTYRQVRSALYEMWVRHNQQLVEKASGGTLGYLHIQSMNMPSFYRFEQELYKLGVGKDGLVIDVRENGGGFTTDHLLTALTQPQHAITVPRGGGPGYPQDRMIYATWRKPIVVLCNQNSFSNAEIFSHAIKTLHRGQLVGVPTSGSVISTGAARIMDVGMLRLPFRGWFLAGDGRDMELNGAVPHHLVWPQPGELPGGKDRQLEKAIQVLRADVEKWKKRPQPKLQTAAELRAAGGP